MKPHEIAALMERDKDGKPFWLRKFEEAKAAAEPTYARDFEDRARVRARRDRGDAHRGRRGCGVRRLYRARFGAEALL